MPAIDRKKSEVLQNVAKLEGERAEAKENEHIRKKLDELDARGYCYAAPELRRGKQTLFFNASVERAESEAQQLPWLAELNISRNQT